MSAATLIVGVAYVYAVTAAFAPPLGATLQPLARARRTSARKRGTCFRGTPGPSVSMGR